MKPTTTSVKRYAASSVRVLMTVEIRAALSNARCSVGSTGASTGSSRILSAQTIGLSSPHGRDARHPRD